MTPREIARAIDVQEQAGHMKITLPTRVVRSLLSAALVFGLGDMVPMSPRPVSVSPPVPAKPAKTGKRPALKIVPKVPHGVPDSIFSGDRGR